MDFLVVGFGEQEACEIALEHNLSDLSAPKRPPPNLRRGTFRATGLVATARLRPMQMLSDTPFSSHCRRLL